MDKITENRSGLLDAMKAAAEEMGKEVIEVEIHFKNNDVPKYLKMLRKFEEMSRAVSINVKSYNPMPRFYHHITPVQNYVR